MEWVSVKDRLPFEASEMHGPYATRLVIVATRFGDVFPCEFKRGIGVAGSETARPWWSFDGEPEGFITHWCDFPEAPKFESDKKK